MLGIEFWIVRKGDDPWKVAPEVGDAISGHSPRDQNGGDPQPKGENVPTLQHR
jgi:hypothetical protein